MQEVISQLNEIQVRMSRIEARLASITPEDQEQCDRAISLLESYLCQVAKVENILLHKKVELLQKRLGS